MSRLHRTEAIRTILETAHTYTEILDQLVQDGYKASFRTIQRDVETLKERYPERWVEGTSEDGRKKWFRIKPATASAKHAMKDLTVLRVVRQLRDLDDDRIETAITLLANSYPGATPGVAMTEQEMPFIEIGEHEADDINLDVLQDVVTAIQQGYLIHLTYDNNVRKDKLPLRLLEYKGRLYLIAWSSTRKRYEPYRLDRLTAVVRSDSPAVNKRFHFNDFMETRFGLWEGDPPVAHNVVVEITEEATAQNFRDRKWHPSQTITNLDNGGIRISMRCGLSPELTSWILHWTPKIKVIEPQELKDKIRALHMEGLG